MLVRKETFTADVSACTSPSLFIPLLDLPFSESSGLRRTGWTMMRPIGRFPVQKLGRHRRLLQDFGFPCRSNDRTAPADRALLIARPRLRKGW